MKILNPPARKDYCVCSVLQAVFRRYNIYLSQENIAGNLTPDENGFRIDDSKIRGFFDSKGFDYAWRWHDRVSLNELYPFLEDMDRNSGIVGINTHLYLLGGSRDPMLELIDPLDEKVRREELFTLLRIMSKTKGFFGLIRPEYIIKNE